MKRKIEFLGVVGAAALAIGVVGASAAQAAGAPDFTVTPIEYRTVKATFDEGTQTFRAAVGKIRCNEVHGAAVLTGRSNELTIEEIEYTGECKALGTFPTTVHTNGCHFKFTVEETETATTSKGSVHLICPGTPASITITVFEAGTVPSEHGNEAKRICTLHIPGGQKIGGIAYHNIETTSGQMHVTVESNGEEAIHDTHEGSLCGTGESNTDSYEGKFIASAEGEKGEPTNFTIEDTP